MIPLKPMSQVHESRQTTTRQTDQEFPENRMGCSTRFSRWPGKHLFRSAFMLYSEVTSNEMLKLTDDERIAK